MAARAARIILSNGRSVAHAKRPRRFGISVGSYGSAQGTGRRAGKAPGGAGTAPVPDPGRAAGTQSPQEGKAADQRRADPARRFARPVANARGEPASFARRVPSREG